jgi:hypothetical protein
VPEQELADPSGSYRLAATAGLDAATGVARMAWGSEQGSSGGLATTSVKVEGAVVTASAETVNEALSYGGGALRIASARSRSVTTYSAGADAPVTVTDLAVEGASAGGVSFSYGANGLVVANQGVPIPATDGLAQINQALAPAGVTVRMVGEAPVAGGRSADAFEVATTQAPPIPGVPPSVVRQRIGGATSAVLVGDDGPVTDIPLPGPGESVLPPDPMSAPVDGPAAASGPGGPAGSGATDGVFLDRASPGGAGSSVGGGFPRSDGGFPLSAGLAVAAPASAGAGNDAGGAASPGPSVEPRMIGPVASLQPLVGPRELDSLGVFYSVLVGAFVILLAGATVWQLKGVRR